MSSFINTLIDRSIAPEQSIQPRVRGRFEDNTTSAVNFLNADTGISQKKIQIPGEQFMDLKVGNETHVVAPKYPATIYESFPSVSSKTQIPVNPLSEAQPNQPTIQSKYSNEKSKPKRLEPDHRLVPEIEVRENDTRQNHHFKKQEKVNTAYSGDSIDNTGKKITGSNNIQLESVHDAVIPVIFPGGKSYTSALRLETPVNSEKQGRNPFTGNPNPPFEGFLKQGKSTKSSQTINVTIGRVEVRLTRPVEPVQTKPKTEAVNIMSLDTYLEQRNQGSK